MFTWDMRYADAKKFDGMILWWGSMNGPKARPGNYTVEMGHNGKKQSASFAIVGNPKLNQSQADFDQQYAFIKEVNDKVTAAHETVIEIRTLKDQLAKYKSIVSDHASIVKEIGMVDSTLNAIENELYQTKNRSNQDPLNYPIKLTNKLAHLNSLTQIGDFPPTKGAIEVKDELIQRIDKQLDLYQNIKTEGIKRLNDMIRTQHIDYIQIPKKE
jgi:hypothetical protein